MPALVRYPQPKIPVPAGTKADDLVAANDSAWQLASHAHMIVFWLDTAVSPLGFSVGDLTAEKVLAGLPDEVDQQVHECEALVAPLRLELISPANCFAEKAFYAPCAHDAVLRYACGIRRELDTIARIATKTFAGWGAMELLPGRVLRDRWEEIVQTYRDHPVKPFDGLPSIHLLLNRLIVETSAAIQARVTAAAQLTSARAARTEKQREVLLALDRRALTLKALAEMLECDPSRLQRDHLKPLMMLGHIQNDGSVGGYYRPDAPPALA